MGPSWRPYLSGHVRYGRGFLRATAGPAHGPSALRQDQLVDLHRHRTGRVVDDLHRDPALAEPVVQVDRVAALGAQLVLAAGVVRVARRGPAALLVHLAEVEPLGVVDPDGDALPP